MELMVLGGHPVAERVQRRNIFNQMKIIEQQLKVAKKYSNDNK